MNEKEIQEILLKEFDKHKDIKNAKIWGDITDSLMISLKNVDLSQYIDHTEIYKLEKIDDDLSDDLVYKSTIIEINNAIKERIVSDLYIVEISSFYPSVIKQLIESDILDTHEDFNKVFLTIFYFIQNNRRTKLNDTINNVISIYSDHFHTFYKAWLNYTFGMIQEKYSFNHRVGKYHSNIDIKKYINNIFREIIKEFNWVYVDTDCIFCYKKDKEDIKEIFNSHDLSYNIEPVMYAYFKGKKRYLYTDGKGSISYKGIKMGSEHEVACELRMKYRNDEIDKVLEG